MRWLSNSAWRGQALVWACVCAIAPAQVRARQLAPGRVWAAPAWAAAAKDKPKAATVRWSESQPGCTFSVGEDGKYRYGLWAGDVGVILAVDAREVQIIRRRIAPIFGVLLTVRVRGDSAVDMRPDQSTMQFMKHFKVVQSSLDPDDYSEKIQADADEMEHETEREIAKHPEQKEAREKRLQEYEKSANEMIEFVSKKGLRAARLDRATPEASGWIFFNTDNKWLGGWKAQEEFVLRVPVEGKIFEFPFKLPPKQGELLLRKRE
jgi:hypothetical protein